MELWIAALAPVVAVALFVWDRDPEKEPNRLLIWAFVLGALGVVPTLLAAWILSPLGLDPMSDSLAWSFVSIAVVVATVEELSKFFGVRMWIYHHKEFDEPFDGIVYCVMAALGFAAVENVMYVMQGGLQVALVRAIFAIPAHAIMGVFIGYFLGLQKHTGKKGLEFVGLAAAVAFHTVYDFFAIQNDQNASFFGFFLASFIFAFRMALRAIRAHRMHGKPTTPPREGDPS